MVLSFILGFATALSLAALIWTVRNRRVQGELQNARKQAEDARRLKSEFIANVSHELKAPLNSVIGYVDLVRERKYGEITNEQADILRRVHDAADRLLTLIKSLLDFSGADLGKIETKIGDFDLNKELVATLEMTEKLAEHKGLRVVRDLDPNVGHVRSDAQKIHLAVNNVLNNAAKFTSEGSITLRSKPLESGELVLIEVEDTGIGIPDTELPHVFEEFRQADGSIRRDYGGTGLGLSIAQKFIHFLGGEIEIRSRLGKGTVVRMVVPRSIEHPMRREAERAPARHVLRKLS